MRQKAGELDQQIDIVAKRVARYECLVKSVGHGVASQLR
jgi:hypothetical protein